MTKKQFIEYCASKYGTFPDYPFDKDFETAVLRHTDNHKWYALVMRVSRRKFGLNSDEVIDVVNLKLPTEMFGSFGASDGVYPAYHMNKLHWISVLLSDAPEGVISFLTNASFEATKSKLRNKKINKRLNITNGDVYNDYFISKYGEAAIPFREVMMDGDTVLDVFSPEFIALRSAELNVGVKEYRANMLVYDALNSEEYSEINLWFGKDTFCQMNLLALLAYLEQIHCKSKVSLNYVDDESFSIIESNISVDLGIYKNLYQDILICKQAPSTLGVLDRAAVELYFDYHSNNGTLAKIIRENSDKEDKDIICLLLKSSKAYGLSDVQAGKLIKKYKR